MYMYVRWLLCSTQPRPVLLLYFESFNSTTQFQFKEYIRQSATQPNKTSTLAATMPPLSICHQDRIGGDVSLLMTATFTFIEIEFHCDSFQRVSACLHEALKSKKQYNFFTFLYWFLNFNFKKKKILERTNILHFNFGRCLFKVYPFSGWNVDTAEKMNKFSRLVKVYIFELALLKIYVASVGSCWIL